MSGACFLVRRSRLRGGRRLRRVVLHVRRGRRPVLAAGPGRMGGGLRAGRRGDPRQGVSTERHPYRMIVEHHRSLLRFAARSSAGWRRLLLPLVAVGAGPCGLAWPSFGPAQGRRPRRGLRSPGCRVSSDHAEQTRRANGSSAPPPPAADGPIAARCRSTGTPAWSSSASSACCWSGSAATSGPTGRRPRPGRRPPSSSGTPRSASTSAARSSRTCRPAPTPPRSGLTANGNGVLTIAPKNSSESGANATLGKFVSDYKGLELTRQHPAVPGRAGL